MYLCPEIEGDIPRYEVIRGARATDIVIQYYNAPLLA
jgi:hypothetical protein